MKTYTLKNAVDLNKAYPDTFKIPTVDEVKSIERGDFCKLLFTTNVDGFDTERMWVKVTSFDPDHETFTGMLVNDPVVCKDLRYGDLISFNHFDIAGICPEDF